MCQEEVIIKIIDGLNSAYPNLFDQQLVKGLLEEIFYDYEINPAQKALVLRNNILEKAFLYLASKRIDGLKELTLKSYALHLKHFASYVSKNIEDITAMDIRIYLANYAKKNVKDTTMATKISTLKSFFSWLENEEYIRKSPMRKIKNIKINKYIRNAIEVEDFELLREFCKTPRQRALLEIFYSTGCRLVEIAKLNKDDINWQTLTVKVVGKGGKERVVYISAKAKVHLKKYLLTRADDCEALFVTQRKPYRRMGHRSIQREIGKIGEAAGINIYPHLIRHTTATNLLNNGADLVTVQHILGHENPSTTQIYAKMSRQNIELEYRKRMIQ
jgi:integrase/recombinase XerD